MADGAGFRNNMESIEDNLTITVDALRRIREMSLSQGDLWVDDARKLWIIETNSLLSEIMDVIGIFSDCAVGLDRIGTELERVHKKVDNF